MAPSDAPKRMLDPVEPGIAVFPGFARDDQTTLVFKEKVFNTSEETFDVVDEDGTAVVRATGKPMRLKNIKRITDTSGSTIFQITASYQGNLQRAFTGTTDAGTEMFRAEKKWSWGTKIEVTFTNCQTNAPTKLFVKGWGLMTTAEVTLEDGQVIAIFTREFWGKALLSNSKSYHLNVAAGVDLAFMTALCIIFDECKFDDAKHSG